jgi:glycosyltransferase involved in cell wall biosynthesis
MPMPPLRRLRALLPGGAPPRPPSPPARTASEQAGIEDPADLDAALAAARVAIGKGDPEPAVELARRLLHADERTPAQAARAAALLGEVNDPDAVTLAVRARARWHAGDLSLARDDANASLAARDIATTRGLVRGIEGELRTLTPGWLPQLEAPRADPTGAPRTPRRVLHLVSGSRPWLEGGFAIRTHEVGRAQLAAGLDPHIATPPGFPGRIGVAGAPDTDVLDRVTYHRLDPDAKPGAVADQRITAAAIAFAALAEQLEPSVIAAAETASIMETTAQAALAVGRARGLPVILEVRGFRDEAWHLRAGGGAPPERYPLLRAADAATWAAADAVVTLGAGMRTELVARGVPDELIVLVPNAIDPDRFTPGPRDATLAADLGIGPEDVVVGYVGSLAAYEGVDMLVSATRALLDRGRPVRLLVVGDGEVAGTLRTQAVAIGLGDAAIFTGRVAHERVVPHIRLIDIFVAPRPDHRLTRLVTPIKPVEALAAGCAVVVSDLPALTELVTDGATGRTFPAGQQDALVEVLDGLVTDPDQRGRLRAAGSAWARSERTWAANGLRYRELVDRLTGS